MNKLRRKVYMTAGYNTVSMGTGRKEFHPKKPRPGLEDYIREAGRGTLAQAGGALNIDEGVIGNFMAARFNGQGNLAAFIPAIDEGLQWKPCTRVEGACASGALALAAGIKSVLAETSEMVLALGVEVQNTVKAIYGADILATAGWSRERKAGHAYFFPGKFSDRAGAYFEKYGRERTRKAMARWYRNAIENARLCPTAQEFTNATADLEVLALTEPSPSSFVDHLNVFDCSKVSDGASAIAIASEEGLKRAGIPTSAAVEIVGIGQAEADLTVPPADLTRLETTARAVEKALASACITVGELATVETHDCFTISEIMEYEDLGFCEKGRGGKFVQDGQSDLGGKVPVNTRGGLLGCGHPLGATGIGQAIELFWQFNSKVPAKRQVPDAEIGLAHNLSGLANVHSILVYGRDAK